jgi:hypothetical protein
MIVTMRNGIVRGLVTSVVALVIFASATSGCSDHGVAREHCSASEACSTTTTGTASAAGSAPIPIASVPPPTVFCHSATAVLNQNMSVGNYAGTRVLSQLQSIDTSDLPSAVKASFEDTVGSAEKMLRLNGPDGWTTKGVADAASRICGTAMTSWNVKP